MDFTLLLKDDWDVSFFFFLEYEEEESVQVGRLTQCPTNGRKEIQGASIPVLEGRRY